MLFNSIEFILFLPIVFCLYWFVFQKSLRWQNAFVVLASYTFYGWWDWKFLALIIFSSVADYLIGREIGRSSIDKKRKQLLITSLLVNLSVLGFFKYCNFFIDSFIDAFEFLGLGMNRMSLNIILPVGISFYTFQTLSYTIDVYRKKLEPTNDVFAFFAFVSFFPQLVAGPIERAKNLLPQFVQKRKFDLVLAKDGLRQMLWGLFKKVVIADNCAIAANDIFANYGDMSGSTLVLGTIFFTIQIYGDFSGYSDIAIGCARLFGFNLKKNFDYPYFSRDIAEHWRRWHISLSTWFRDYLYIPLGGSKNHKIRNVFIIFVVSGFWHGANWTFIFWGFLHALYFLPLLLTNSNRKHLDPIPYDRLLPSFTDFLKISLTFGLLCFAFIFFRSESMLDAFNYIKGILNTSIFERPLYLATLPFIFVLMTIDWVMRRKEHPLQIQNIHKIGRWSIYYLLIGCILYFKPKTPVEFIYFQF